MIFSVAVHGTVVGWAPAGHAFNKALPRCDNSGWLLVSSSACRGGEGTGGSSTRQLQVRHLEVPSSLSLSHGSRRWSALFSGELLWWEVASESILDREVNKCGLALFLSSASAKGWLLLAGRGGEEKEKPLLLLPRSRRSLPHRRTGGFTVFFLLLACHGGEGKDEGHLKLMVHQRCSGERLDLHLPWADLKRRPLFAAAIFGQEADPASLGNPACQSVFFLCERNILSLAASAQASARPSGFVPGLDRGGRGCRLFVAGGEFGPDCVFAIFFRVKNIDMSRMLL